MWKQLRSAVDDVKEFGTGAISEVSQGVNEVRLHATYKQGACLGHGFRRRLGSRLRRAGLLILSRSSAA